MIPADHITALDDQGRMWLTCPNEYTGWIDDDWMHQAFWRRSDRPCDACDGSGHATFGNQVHTSERCPDCHGTGRRVFEIKVQYVHPLPGHHAKEMRTRTLLVHVVPDMVLPIYDECPDYNPPNHVCQCYQDGRWFWHIGGPEHDRAGTSDTERPITLPPAAEPGMWAIKLREVTR